MQSSTIDAVERFLQSNLSEYLRILQSWVEINSFTANSAGVDRLGELTAKPFQRMGFTLKRVPSASEGYGAHVVLSRPGSGPQTIGLVSHLDTVFPPDEEAENGFRWRIDKDRVYGPGTVDIKGGTLMILMFLHSFQAFEPELFESVSWIVMLDASEETMSEDFGALCRSHLSGARACLVFEGGFYEEGTFKLVRMRKGMAKFTLRVDGKASHAGVAHADGANAIVQLAESVRKIANLTDYDKNITFNIGAITGGTVTNRVPHYAEARGEMRAFDKSVFEEGLAQLESLEKQVEIRSAAGEPCRLSVEIYEITKPWPLNDGTEALLETWTSAAEELGYRIFPEARGGLSDGNHTWHLVPTLDGLGPGGGNAHCSVHDPAFGREQEFLYLPSLIPKTLLNYLGIRNLIHSG